MDLMQLVLGAIVGVLSFFLLVGILLLACKFLDAMNRFDAWLQKHTGPPGRLEKAFKWFFPY